MSNTIRNKIISNIRYVGNAQFRFKKDYTLRWNGKRYSSNDPAELVEKAIKDMKEQTNGI